MNLMEKTYGMWSTEAEADADELAARIGHHNNAINQWKAHAEKLQKALDELRVIVVDKSCALAAQAALKDKALTEIQKMDPSNKLLDADYRKKIYDDVKTKTEKEMFKEA